MPLVRGDVAKIRDIAVSSNTLIHHTPIIAKCSVVTDDGWCLHYAGTYGAGEGGGAMGGIELISTVDAVIPTEPALFCLTDDPDEEHDLIASRAALAHDILDRYVAFLEEIHTPAEHLAGRRKLRG